MNVIEEQAAVYLQRRHPGVPANTVQAVERLLDAVADRRARAAFVSRVVNALSQLTEQMDDNAMMDAAGAPSDYAALLQVLEQPEALAALRNVDPLGPARLRGLRAQDWLLNQEGGTLSAEQMARVLRITRQAVDKRRQRNAIIGINLGRRGYAYPAWQVGDAGTLPGLETVMIALGDVGPWAQAAFFLTANICLDGETPLSALRRGDLDRVVAAAEHLGDQVAV